MSSGSIQSRTDFQKGGCSKLTFDGFDCAPVSSRQRPGKLENIKGVNLIRDFRTDDCRTSKLGGLVGANDGRRPTARCRVSGLDGYKFSLRLQNDQGHSLRFQIFRLVCSLNCEIY